jgi:predicted transcriptional regulator of viral defense system/very-short-patch-repair endonuclease
MPERGRETGTYGRSLGQVGVDAALAGVAASQHAVFRVDQLRELGLSESAVHKRAAAGRLHRIHRCVYSLVPPELLTREGHWLAAVLACGPGAVLSHRSAAALHELRRTERSKIDVTVPVRSSRQHRGIDLHRSTTLTERDTTVVNNIPCTTVARTQLDIAEVINERGVERLFDQAETMEVFDLRALTDQLERNHKRRAARVVRRVLATHYPGSTPTWSEIEEAFLALVRRANLPSPELNRLLLMPDGDPPIRPDFMWRAHRVTVETDGRKTHRTRQAFERDRRNDQRLIAIRWRPVRVTWKQIFFEPDRLSGLVVGLLRG